MSEPIIYSPDELISKYLDPEAIARYFDLLMEENRRVNLVSRETTPESFERLVAESLVPLEIVGTGFRSLLDIGAGGGLPAFPLLMALPGMKRAVMVERTLKKARALRGLVQNLGLSARVVDRNYEEFRPGEKFDLITIRLVKLTSSILDKALSELTPRGRIVYWSAPQFDLRKHDVVVHNFKSSQDQVIKKLTVIAR